MVRSESSNYGAFDGGGVGSSSTSKPK